MHYIPESTGDWLSESPTGSRTTSEEGRLSRSWGFYGLTAIVGLLLVLDLLGGDGLGLSGLAGKLPGGWKPGLIAAVLGGGYLLFRTIDGLLAGRVGADLALTVACLAAIAAGESQTAALVVWIALLGETIERFTSDRAAQALRATCSLLPSIAHVVAADQERDVLVTAINLGDVLRIRPGERIPADGVVTAGSSRVDQAVFTGESWPVTVEPGTTVWAGTVNQLGALEVRVTATGPATEAGRLRECVTQAIASRTDGERLAEQLARWFLVVVLVIGAATWAGWWIKTGTWRSGVLPTLGVLVVACPCPLVLATPSAVLAALAWLARRGIVVKSAAALERLAEVTVFAFDKTGTLTVGAPELVRVVPLGTLDEPSLRRLAGIAERSSEHPLGRALVRSAQEVDAALPAASSFTNHPGLGIEAVLPPGSTPAASSDQPTVRLGSLRLWESLGISVSESIQSAYDDACRSDSGTTLLMSVDEDFVGLLTVADALRETAADTLAELQGQGVRELALLTGDHPQAAAGITQRLPGWSVVRSSLTPKQKAEWVQRRQAEDGARVAMVGDGVNDALALAVADVGLAVGKAGGDLTAAAGDFVLLGEPLTAISALVRMARALVRNIRWNILGFAVVVNGIGMIVCALGWLSPVGAAVFHEVASLLVMANALRLLTLDTGWSRRVQRQVEQWQRWVDGLRPNEVFDRLACRWRQVLQLAACGAAAVWLLSGVIVVNSDEVALVKRFGRHHTTLEPGWHWRWPLPLEVLHRLQPDRVRVVDLVDRSQKNGEGIQRSAGGAAAPSSLPIEWTATHGDGGLAEESLWLTGDELLIALNAEVTYRVSDPQQFLDAGGARPEEVLRAALRATISELVSRHRLDDLLAERRHELEQATLARMQRGAMEATLGITLLEVRWLDVHPPQTVVTAYRDVAAALETRELLRNQGELEATRTLLAVAGERAWERYRQAGIEAGAQAAAGDVPVAELIEVRAGPFWSQLLRAEIDRGRTAAETWLGRRGPPALRRGEGSLVDLPSADQVGDVGELAGTSAAVLHAAAGQAERQRQTAIAQSARLRALVALHQPWLRVRLLQEVTGEVLSQRAWTWIDPRIGDRVQLWLGTGVGPTGMGVGPTGPAAKVPAVPGSVGP